MEEVVRTPRLEFPVGNYTVKLALDGSSIVAVAFSEVDSKLFKSVVQENELKEIDRITFGDCEGIYNLIEECLLSKLPVQLSDIGELKFVYFTGTNRKRIERSLEFRLE